MMNWSDWNVNADVQFSKQSIRLRFSKNLSTTKYFRNYIVEENEINDGPKKISFATSNANYVLTFEVI